MNKKINYIILLLLVILILIFLGIGKKLPQAIGSESISLKDGDSYDMTASYVSKNIAGREQKMLAYNNSIPGPSINVEQGSEIIINFKNETDIPQLLHSHGVRVENAFDGSQMVQEEIKPGETFQYKLKFPDAGIYWYHPHAGEVYGQARGLYGAFVVKPKSNNYFPKVNREVTLFLSDLLIENGKIETSKDDTDHTLMGHFGNVILVNGEENYKLQQIAKGEVVRFYVVNSANTRPFNFVIEGAKMKLVGGDSGAYERATSADSVVLGPSERVIIDAYFPESHSYLIKNTTPEKDYIIGMVEVSQTAVVESFLPDFNTLQTNTDTVKSIDQFRKYFTKNPDKNITLTIDTKMMGSMNHGMHNTHDSEEKINLMGMQMTKEQAIEHCKMMPEMVGCEPYLNVSDLSDESKEKSKEFFSGIEWNDSMSMMNSMTNNQNISWKIIDTETKKENMNINWILKKDEPIKIRIFNDPNSPHPMQHPIHFHGQRFLIVSRNGVLQDNLVWKDTALVKTGETVDVVLDPSNIGMWMAHCHISEHLANGMMFGFEVRE